MDENAVLGHIHELVEEEKQLRAAHHGLTGEDRQRLQNVEQQLDRDVLQAGAQRGVVVRGRYRLGLLGVDRAGVELSEWEGEFLGSVAERVTTYGRAFGDPEKGAPGSALSARQGVKLKEIAAKASGKPKPSFRRRSPLGKSREPD